MKKKIDVQQSAKRDFFVSLTSKLGNSSMYPSLFDLLPSANEAMYDMNDDTNVVHFEEVRTSEIIKHDSDKYLDIRSSIEKEQLIDEQSLSEMFSDLPKSIVDEIEKRTKGQAENALW